MINYKTMQKSSIMPTLKLVFVRIPAVYRNVTQYNDQQKHSHDSVTNLNILPSDLKKKRTPTVYQSATQYNNQENNTAMTVSPSKI